MAFCWFREKQATDSKPVITWHKHFGNIFYSCCFFFCCCCLFVTPLKRRKGIPEFYSPIKWCGSESSFFIFDSFLYFRWETNKHFIWEKFVSFLVLWFVLELLWCFQNTMKHKRNLKAINTYTKIHVGPISLKPCWGSKNVRYTFIMNVGWGSV